MQALSKLVDLENSAFDPFLEEKRVTGDTDDPYPLLQKFLSESPLHKRGYRELFSDLPDTFDGLEQYLVLGHDLVMAVLTDSATYTNRGAYQHTLGLSFGRTISVMDAPEHPRFRRIFQKAFSPKVIIDWGEAVVEPVIDRLLGKFAARGEADLVEDFTHHYPFQVIYRQLMLDDAQASIFHRLAIAQQLTRIHMPEGYEASTKLGIFFQDLINRRRAEPIENDLVTQLATVEAEGERLPDEVIISFLRQLMNAGGDTTYRGTSNLLTGLLTHPDQLAAVKADRSLIPQAIEETLRWEGPSITVPRYVAQDTVLAGQSIPAGAIMNVMLGSANRDPSKYPNPDSFDIFRPRNVRAVPFAGGPHVCIGQHLARLEMTRALNALLDRLPNLRLDPDSPPPIIIGFKLRVAQHIFVRFDPTN